jgi:hypothetical protein
MDVYPMMGRLFEHYSIFYYHHYVASNLTLTERYRLAEVGFFYAVALSWTLLLLRQQMAKIPSMTVLL